MGTQIVSPKCTVNLNRHATHILICCLVVSVSAYETRGPRSIPWVGTYFQTVFFSSSFFAINTKLLHKKGHHQNDGNGQSLTFDIELCMKSMRVVLDFGPPDR